MAELQRGLGMFPDFILPVFLAASSRGFTRPLCTLSFHISCFTIHLIVTSLIFLLFSSLFNSPPSLDSWTCRASFTKLHHQYIASIYGSNLMPRSACRIVDQSLRDIVCRAGKWRESPFTHHPHPTWKHLVDLCAYNTLMYAFDALIDSSLTYHTSSAQGRFYLFHGPHQIRSRRESNRGMWINW